MATGKLSPLLTRVGEGRWAGRYIEEVFEGSVAEVKNCG
jgi:hypothetical protein